MAQKIRGFQWAMTARGFELYAARRDETLWIGRPGKLIDQVPADTELVGTFEEVLDLVDRYWELQGK